MSNTNEAIPKSPDADEFDVRAALRRVSEACLRHKLIIVASCALTIGMMAAYIVIWPPVYSAHVTVVAEPEQDRVRDDFYGAWSVFRSHDIDSEAEMMTSKPVLSRVIRELDLTYDDVYHPFLRYAGHLWTESWVGKRYRRMKKSLFPPDPSPYAPTEEEIDFAKTLDDFMLGVSVQSAGDAHVGHLVVRGPSPRVAEMADAVINTYFDERLSRQLAEARAAADTLRKEVAKAHAELSEIEDRREEYYDENSLLLEFEKDKVEISQWLELEASIIEEEASVESMKRTLDETRRVLATEPREMVASRVLSRNEHLENIKAHRFTLQTRLHDALLRYREDSAEIREIHELLASVDALVAAENPQVELSSTTVVSDTYESLRQQAQSLETTLAGAQRRLDVKRRASAEIKERIDNIPQKMRMAHDLGRTQNALENKLLLLQEKLMMAEIFVTTVRTTPPSIQVVSYASAPAKPDWPKWQLLIALAGALGLGVGVGAAVLFDTVRGRVSADRLAQVGDAPPLYATIEFDQRRARRSSVPRRDQPPGGASETGSG